MKTIFAWGWTWGHILPSMAIANFLEWEKLFLISRNNLDEEILKNSNFKYKKIFSWKLRRYFSFFAFLENFLDIFKFILGFFQSLKIIYQFNPDIIFCKWGFVSLPIAFAGKILWKKIVLHESDLVMWISNKIISKFAIKIFRWEEIWNPINFNWKIFSEKEKKFFKKEKKIPENKKILFVSWWSQWAEKINKLIEKNFTEIEKNFFVIHLTWIWKKINIKSKNYLEFEFLNSDEYFDFLQIADLVVSRAWAWSIAEILFFQKPAILIPLIWSAWEHQLKNVDKSIKTLVQHVARSVISQAITLDEHEELIIKALEKAKRQGIFGKRKWPWPLFLINNC